MSGTGGTGSRLVGMSLCLLKGSLLLSNAFHPFVGFSVELQLLVFSQLDLPLLLFLERVSLSCPVGY